MEVQDGWRLGEVSDVCLCGEFDCDSGEMVSLLILDLQDLWCASTVGRYEAILNILAQSLVVVTFKDLDMSQVLKV